MFDIKLLSCVHILFVVSPYPVDLVGHIGRNKAMQQYLVVESLCVPQLYIINHNRKSMMTKAKDPYEPYTIINWTRDI